MSWSTDDGVGGSEPDSVDAGLSSSTSIDDADDEPEERRGLTDRVRGLFGRGSRANRPANDDRSDLVTPFFADDFGR